MRTKSPFKQFAKDCPKHFNQEILMHANLKPFNSNKRIKLERSTFNSSSPIKF
jgi:hypothetical protein